MKMAFYPKLAWTGIRKNRRLYTPYLLTCSGMVMMHYIITSLCYSETINGLPGIATLRAMLDMGSWIIALFSLIFLFYTNSFLVRRRMKEFGLYNILGMGKRNIGRILFWETLISAAISLLCGLFLGVVLSKLAELGLVNIMRGDVGYRLLISKYAIATTVPVFCAIFALIFLFSLIRIGKTDAIALLRSESAGEKPPKANWFLGVLGVILLGGAYYIAVTIQDPVSALIWFFVAVGMVILATYLLFVAGSVLLCRVLQRNKHYYYKANHFVSVSSMSYRMKRNGAGLASICILATMVLVMLCSTSCLYFGSEDALRNRYPMDINVDARLNELTGPDAEVLRIFRDAAIQTCADQGVSPEDILEYRSASITGRLNGTEINPQVDAEAANSLDFYNDVRTVNFVPLEDYNQLAGTNEVLEDGEALLYAVRTSYNQDSLSIRGGPSYRIVRQLDSFPCDGDAMMDIFSSLYVVIPDYETALVPLVKMPDGQSGYMLSVQWYYGFDLDAEDGIQETIYLTLCDQVHERRDAAGLKDLRYLINSRSVERADFYSLYGGFFFLGIALSIVFLFAAVLIIYYKQVSEGYEDQRRFEIMQKVGMTKQEIRRSINSQLLTVFYLPLLTAGLHLIFAFPLVQKLLLIFNLTNLRLLIATTLTGYLIFALFYLLVYRITSNAYYAIVSNGRQE